MTPTDGSSTKESIARIEELVLQVEALPDTAARASAIDLVRAVMSLHAAALERVLEIVAAPAPDPVRALGADELVSGVLALHGLHPDGFDTRFARAVDKLEQFFDSRGGSFQVLEASPELVRVRVTLSRPGSAEPARRAIEDAVYEAVPELSRLVVEGADREEPSFVPLSSLLTVGQP